MLLGDDEGNAAPGEAVQCHAPTLLGRRIHDVVRLRRVKIIALDPGAGQRRGRAGIRGEDVARRRRYAGPREQLDHAVAIGVADRIRGVDDDGTGPGRLLEAIEDLAALGQQGEDKVHELALFLGLLVFLVPTILVLLIMLPSRIRQIRQLGAANAALVDTHDPERRRLLAMRAAFGLSYLTLLGYTRDPIGDLAAGRYDRLVDAALDDVGIRRPAVSASSGAAPR